ncbi:hypothetical protein A6M21_12570 [Desulfotomaculum copahuensis]|uniref:histidine kinase n=2 Tax=Desulfotomaculum copahuensis TaxID=1838280 RepID=A0A1B7LD68_9FIRM|nr:hypothetical protein A6M21_12570 [Desulfotomaculum copahuensis]
MLRAKKLSNLLLIMMLVLLLFPVALTLYMVSIMNNSELALVENQKAKLNRAVDDLDSSMHTSFTGILSNNRALTAPRDKQAAVLNQALREPINQISRKYPRVQVGFYLPSLNLVLDGSSGYRQNIPPRYKSAFEEVLSRQDTVVHTIGHGSSGVLEIYRPYYRDDKLEAVIWATENLGHTSFYDRIRQMEINSYAAAALVIFFALGGALLLMRSFVKGVQRIKEGLQTLQYDLDRRLPEAPGELGEIAGAINGLAERLTDVYKYNQLMLATIDDAMLVVDAAGRVVIANAAAARIFELPPDCQDRHFNEIFPSGSPFTGLLQNTLETGRQYKDFKPGAGAPQLLASTALLTDGRQHKVGAVLYCRDVTETMRLEDRVHRQERLASLGKLVAGVAHEIRNPLTSISCYIQLWQKTNKPSPRALATMYSEVTRLEGLVEQLLYFARPAESRFVPYELNRVVEKVLRFFREVYRQPPEIHARLAPDLPPAWIDPDQIERVLMNVIYNSCQAMPDGGRLEVETAYDRPSDSLLVTLTDSGCGIPAGNMRHIFEPFFTTREKGMGLGLAIAHEIIQAHGGNIEVESRVNRGTTFRIYLQRKEETHAPVSACSG